METIQQYDFTAQEIEAKTLEELEQLLPELDRDIGILKAQVKNHVTEEDECDDDKEKYVRQADDLNATLGAVRRKEDAVIIKSRELLKDYRQAFNLRRFCEVARGSGKR